ncbi:MAG TPA: YciC family protein [Solirubrobacterales bacterium]
MAERLTTLRAYAGIWRLYLSWAPLLLVIGAIVFIPVGLIHALAITLESRTIEFGSPAEIAGTLVALILLAITGLLGEVFYTGALAALMTGEHEDHEPPSLHEIAREVEYGRLILIDVIYAVLVAVGFILLFVPGVIAFVFLALAAPLIEIEGRGVRDALGHSIRLVRGRFWTVLSVLLPIELLGDALTDLLTDLPHHLIGSEFIANWLADVLGNLATTPFYGVAAVLLTVELIREKEGDGPRIHSVPGR